MRISQPDNMGLFMKTLFLLDGHALAYRAHYSFITRPLLNSKGQNVSAITGFMNYVTSILKKERPTHIGVSFDLKGPTFRHEMYEPYKANREAQPEDITLALPYIVQILEGMRIPIVTCEGFEADDVIGTLAKKAEKEGFQVMMMTPDKDYGQLVSENIFMYKPGKKGDEAEVWGIKEVCENWDIARPEQVIDILGLQGDSVDNIPGLPGIGPKSAAALLKLYDSVEGVIENVDKLKGKQQETVRNFAEQGLLSKRLAVISLDVPVEFVADDYLISAPDKEILIPIFKELEFRTLAVSLLGVKSLDDATPAAKSSDAPKNTASNAKKPDSSQLDLFGGGEDTFTRPEVPTAPAAHSVAEFNINNTAHTYILCDTEDKIETLLSVLTEAKSFCFDTETTAIDANQAELVGMSFAVKAHEAYYVPVPENQVEARNLVARFAAVMQDPTKEKIAQNIKYDLIMFKRYGLVVMPPHFDTMLAHYIYEPEMRHNMDYLSTVYLKYEPVSITTLIGKGKTQTTMRDAPLADVANYAAEDADVTLQLKDVMLSKLKDESQLKLLHEVEFPLAVVLADMEAEGVRIDPEFLNIYAGELVGQIRAAEQLCHELAGKPFNVASPKQVGEMLFETMKIPNRRSKSAKSGNYSTDEEVLSELAPNYPIAEAILRYRTLSKLNSTYVEALPRSINPLTGRIHSSFNQALAASGRLSSNNPNLQNIPIRTPEGRRVRQAFIPRDSEHTLLSADYSQVELRLIAEISGDTAMLEAFQLGQDIHQATAARVYGVPLESVTPDQRRNAKTVNFSIIYGAGALNVSQQLGISRAEAKTLIDNYFAQYSGLKAYMERIVAEAREHGFVTTLLGRRRYLRDIDSRNGLARSNAERVAINTPIQGSAADLIKVAMINIHRELRDRGLRTRLILQVHDELVFDVFTPELTEVTALVHHCMTTAIPGLKVTIEVGIGTGQNWLAAH